MGRTLSIKDFEVFFLLTRIRKTLCYMGNHPNHTGRTLAASKAIEDIDEFMETHGPTAEELLSECAGLNHFDRSPEKSDD